MYIPPSMNPTTAQFTTFSDSSPSSARSPANLFYRLRMSCSSFLCTSSMDVQTLLLALGPLTCEYAARLHLCSSHILIPMQLCIAPLPVVHSPLASLMISPGCCNLPSVQHSSSFAMSRSGFLLLFLRDYCSKLCYVRRLR